MSSVTNSIFCRSRRRMMVSSLSNPSAIAARQYTSSCTRSRINPSSSSRIGGRRHVRVKPSAIAAICPCVTTIFPGSLLLRLDTRL